MLNLVTIERHILEQQRDFPQATGAFTSLLYDMALAAKLIARMIRRAGLTDLLGASDEVNVYGEQQQRLDLYADDMIYRMNDHTGRLCVMASEEHEGLLYIPEPFPTGRYVLLYDPLDGSSNIDVNVSVGTIFAIHRRVSTGRDGTLDDVLQPARNLAAAGYVIYGSSTMLVYSTGQGVHGFTLDPEVGEFLLSHPNMRIPAEGLYYSTNQGYQKSWTPGMRHFVEWLQCLNDDERKPLGARYIGSMVSDFHRNLLRGGIFFYPGDMQHPNGKMRLLFEGQALAFIAEQAGGYASDGLGSILDIQPHSLHQRIPLLMGNRELVEKAEALIQEHDGEWVEAYRPLREGDRSV